MNEEINDIFSNILLSEEIIAEESYKRGFDQGVSEKFNLEAYHLGFHKGVEIGTELGFYLGVLENYQIPPPINEKISNLTTQLRSIIEQFPRTNCESTDLFESLNTIRSHFKKLTALLKIKVSYPVKDQLNF